MVTFARAALLIGEAERHDRHRSGRLDEGGDGVERGIATGRYFRIGLRSLLLPAPRGRRGPPLRVVPLHLRVSAVSKRPPSGKEGLSAKEAAGRKDRVYVKAARGRTSELTRFGGRYDRTVRSWYVPEKQFATASQALGAALHRRDGGSVRRSRGHVQGGAAAAFQRYIERADSSDEERAAEIVTDDEGALVSFGTLGDDAEERASFWDAVEARERADGCVQNRAIIALPYELDGGELKALARDLMAPLAERGLPFHAAVHRPDVAAGSDPRNVHLHALWSERPAKRVGPGAWEFAPRKDRTARGPRWVRELRERSAATINRHLDTADARRRAAGLPGIVRRFDARSYADRGEATLPGVHLGPGRSAMERVGVPTTAGVVNALRAAVNERAEAADRALARRRRALVLLGAPGVPAAVAERLGRALDRLDGAELGIDPTLRVRRRIAWADGPDAAAGGREALAALARQLGERALREAGPPPADDAAARAEVRAAAWSAARAAATHARAARARLSAEREAAVVALRAGRLAPAEAAREELARRHAEVAIARSRAELMRTAEFDDDMPRVLVARRRAAASERAVAEVDALVRTIGAMSSHQAHAAALAVVGAPSTGGSTAVPPRARRRPRDLER